MNPVKIDCEPQINNKAERTTDPHVISGVMNLALKTSKLQIKPKKSIMKPAIKNINVG